MAIVAQMPQARRMRMGMRWPLMCRAADLDGQEGAGAAVRRRHSRQRDNEGIDVTGSAAGHRHGHRQLAGGGGAPQPQTG